MNEEHDTLEAPHCGASEVSPTDFSDHVVPLEGTPVRLNLGAGDVELDGFTPIDRKTGGEVYPLDGYDDGSVTEIRASHVLEHFPYEKVPNVVKHWVAKLRPGGILRIAVPDFDYIAKQHAKGVIFDVQAYVMGGHTDENDHHGAIFNRQSLTELLVNSGCAHVRGWESEIEDCAALPVSLNMMGVKRTPDESCMAKMCGILSCPRYGPTAHMHCATSSFQRLGVPLRMGAGAFWHQVLSEMMVDAIEHGNEFIYTLDYDSIFQPFDLLELYRLMKCYDEVDALCSLQCRRAENKPLFTMVDGDGNLRNGKATLREFSENLTRINTGHFGLTLFRSSSLKDLPQPWFMPILNKNKRWGDNRVDADMAFWKHWKENNRKVFLANRVVVGHLEEVVTWPDNQFNPIRQNINDWDECGMPPNTMRLPIEEQLALYRSLEEAQNGERKTANSISESVAE